MCVVVLYWVGELCEGVVFWVFLYDGVLNFVVSIWFWEFRSWFCWMDLLGFSYIKECFVYGYVI